MNFFIQWGIFEIVNWIVVILVVSYALRDKSKKNNAEKS